MESVSSRDTVDWANFLRRFERVIVLMTKHKRLLHLAISLGLLGFLLQYIDLHGAMRIIAKADVPLLLLAAFLFVPDRLFSAFRWWLLLRRFRRDVSYLEVLRVTLVSGFLGFFMPGTMGAELLRVYGLRSSNVSMAASVSSVVVERYLAIIGLVGLLFLGYLMSSFDLPGYATVTGWICLGIIVGSLLVLFRESARTTTRFLVPRFAKTWMLPKLDKLYEALDEYRNTPALLGQGLVVAFAFQLFRTSHVFVLAMSLGIDVDWVTFLAIEPAVRIATLLPISLAGVGLREAGFVVLLGAVGVSAENAIALSALFLVFVVLAMIPGAFLWKWRVPDPTADTTR